MAKDDIMRFEGRIIDVLPNTNFKVELINKMVLLCHLSGKMRKNNIRVLMGDKVEVELSSYDLTKGRIAFRHR
jgi:translation initiation factor IF-1